MAEPGTSAGRGRAEASAAHPPRGARARGRARRRRTPRRTAPDYVVHETDDDMLLIISNAGARPARAAGKKRPPRAPPGKAVPARKKRREEERAPEPAPGSRVAPASSGAGAQSSWGERLPVEILVRIFQPVVARDGAVPFLCRAARVCRLWYGAASNPVLWQKVSLGFCWGEPGKKRPPLMEERVLGTVEWLATSRFSLLRDFVLCHWKSHVPFVLKALQDSCPLLASLKLSHCSGVTTESLTSLAARCTQLDSLNLQNSQVDSSAVVTFLEVAGTRLQQLWLTYSSRMNAIVAALASGCCPGLRLLEVNTEIKQSSQHFQVPVEQLQAACPQLQVLRLLNVIWSPKTWSSCTWGCTAARASCSGPPRAARCSRGSGGTACATSTWRARASASGTWSRRWRPSPRVPPGPPSAPSTSPAPRSRSAPSAPSSSAARPSPTSTCLPAATCPAG
ncbi:F-box/LRR-repeat protein 6 isoform X2 [Struthio camelus]|uniref:F-box/LRR-repeat protein 6 isoform X2 n=1 Tax=Struthio camelus TaxID=8801 RepID=UPI0036041065